MEWETLSFVQAAGLNQNWEIVKEPVEHVEATGDYVCNLEEILSVAVGDYLDAL